MMVGVSVNSLGLILDILGVIGLFRYGIPPEIDIHGEAVRLFGPKEKNIGKHRRYVLYSKISLGLLIAGFLLQLASNFLKS